MSDHFTTLRSKELTQLDSSTLTWTNENELVTFFHGVLEIGSGLSYLPYYWKEIYVKCCIRTKFTPLLKYNSIVTIRLKVH